MTRPASIRQGRPLAPMQRPLWMSQRAHPDAPVQNMANLSHIDGVVDADRLRRAFAEVVAASDVLSCRIVDDHGRPVVLAHDHEAVTEVVDVERDAAMAWAEQRARTVIDPSVRAYDSVVLRHRDGTASWYLGIHHVVTDAAASARIFQQTAARYHGESLDIAAFGAWVDELADGDDPRTARAVEHWHRRRAPDRLGGLYEPVRTPSSQALRADVDLGASLRGRLEAALGTDYALLNPEMSWTAALVTATATLVANVTQKTGFSIGLPVHNRSAAGAERVIGPLMEIFPLDIELATDDTFRSLHKRVAKTLMTTMRHAAPGHAPRGDTDVLVNVIQGFDFGPFGDLAATHRMVDAGAADSSQLLRVVLAPTPDGELRLFLDLNHAAVGPQHRDRAVAHVRTVLTAMVDQPDARVVELDIRTDVERRAIAAWEHGPDFPSHTPDLVGTLEQALSTSDRAVIDDGETVLTGAEVWDRARRVAATLADDGVVRGDRVGVEMPRSSDAVVAILAILIAGGSYVPLDPEQPRVRLDDLAARAGCRVVLRGLPVPADTALDPVAPSPDDEAYLLFTSGSTGEPKGVPITHLGLARYIRFAAESYTTSDGAQPVVALFTALTFDLTVTSLFVPLVTGGRMVVIGENGGAGLAAVAARPEITWAKATPSHLEVLVRLLPPDHGLRTLVVGGEAFGAGLAQRLTQALPGVRLFNEYGPTEAVVGCMIHESTADERDRWPEVPIGRPAPGVSLAVVDEQLRRVPLGSPGELLISHAGLTAGYLGQVAPQMTEPFVSIEDRRWYRSGDLVRMADAETLVYLGRIDEQIKVGGIRLEPTEVERALDAHPGVERAAVRLWTDQLVAWIEPADPGSVPSPTQLRRHLLDLLPVHAVPSAFVDVAELPTTVNGKLDTAALPAPAREHRTGLGDHAGAGTDTEATVVAAWEEILEVDGIGVDDDFFELGGDSLAALQMVVLVGERCGVEAREELAFLHSTPRALAAAIDAESGSTVDVPVARAAGTPPPTSEAEQAMLFEHRSDPADPRYNIARLYRIEGPVDADRFEHALHTVSQRHVPLSWTYSTPRRLLDPRDAVEVDRGAALLSAAAARTEGARRQLVPWDLDNGPLIKGWVQPLDDGATALMVAVHHISGDAGAIDRLWKDIEGAYLGDDLPPVEIDYADFKQWQQGRLTDADRTFWLDSDDAPSATLALRPPDTPEADGYVEIVSAVTTSALRDAPGSTGFATAFGALAAVLRRYLDGDRVDVGIVASTQGHPVSDPLVGYFLNTLPMALQCRMCDSVRDVCERAGQAIGAGLPHRAYPFGRMVADRRAEGQPPPAARVMLAFEDLAPATLGDHAASHVVLPAKSAVTDATFFVQVRGEELRIGVEYRGSVFGEASAMQVLEDLERVLRAAVDHPDTTVGDLDLDSLASARLEGPPLPDAGPVIARVLDHIAARPDHLAVRCGDATLTWAQLGERSSSLAAALERAGVGRGDRVLMALPRSTDAIAAIVACHRLGASYVPIDPTYPADRIALIASKAGAAAALVVDGQQPLTDQDLVAAEIGHLVFGGADHARPDDEAYVIFTSGSTGEPRGVPVRQRHLAASTEARLVAYPEAPERFLVVSSLAFDSSVAGLFWALRSGTTTVLPTDAEAHDVDALLGLFETADVTHTLLVPTLYRALLERGVGHIAWPHRVIVAGEASSAGVVAEHFARRGGSLLTNEYGPTEATVWATAHHFTPDDNDVPIGPPIAGAWVEVVDADGRPVPTGVVGELVIGGAGVVDGYLDAPEKTAAKFGRDRFGSPIFRTGDRAAIVDGSVRFLGRADHQLNVGGMRAEPEDIERAILADDTVGAAIVVATDPRPLSALIDRATPQELSIAMARAASTAEPASSLLAALREFSEAPVELVAHLEPAGQTPIDPDALRAALADALPAGLRPTRYTVHESLPRTPNGKLDRDAAALLPVAEVIGAAPAVAATETVGVVAALFAEIVGAAMVGPEDSFFDVGGNSLSALKLLDLIEERLDKTVSIASLYENPTASGLAAIVGTSGPLPDRRSYLVPVQTTGTRPAVFGVHVLGENAMYYRALSDALGPDQPVYGLGVATDLADASAPTEVGVIAALYADDLRRAVPHGPVVLAAVSLGAPVALELASLLRAQGRDVRTVALFDVLGPDARGDNLRTRRIESHLRQIRHAPGRYLRDRRLGIAYRLRRGTDNAAITLAERAGMDLPDRLKVRRFIESNVAAVATHEIRPYDGHITVFKAEEDPLGWARIDEQLGWGTIATGGLEIIDVPGGHVTLLSEPHVSVVATELAAAIDRAPTVGARRRLRDRDEIERELVAALYADRLRPAITELVAADDLTPEATELVDAVDRELHTIGDRTARAAEEIRAVFDRTGIDATVVSVPGRLERSVVSVGLTAEDVDGAVRALGGLGYVFQDPKSDGAWAAYRRLERDVSLIKLDALTTRVHLSWGEAAEAGGLGRVVRPTRADLAALDLPRWAWPAYYAVRPVRLALDRAQGRSQGGNLGRFLGTPTSLIEPLLRLAGLRSDELLVDVGCGDGRVLVEAVRAFGCRGRGVERDPALAAAARDRIAAAGMADRIEIVTGDATHTELADADVVFAFLPPTGVCTVLEMCVGALTPGSRVMTHEQAPGDWPTPPDITRLVAEGGITVASIWRMV